MIAYAKLMFIILTTSIIYVKIKKFIMQVYILGYENTIAAFQQIILDKHIIEHGLQLPENISHFDVIIDTFFDTDNSSLSQYFTLTNTSIIVSAAKIQLAALLPSNTKTIFIGMNMLPTFITRQKAEYTLLHNENTNTAENILSQLGWQPLQVEDRVGMVTPRIISMIINEACYTVQEKTATIQGIDVAMKLGTNYPYGPFEWADKIGVKHIYELLLAVYNDTKDERYKICPLLKTKYLKQEEFYQFI